MVPNVEKNVMEREKLRKFIRRPAIKLLSLLPVIAIGYAIYGKSIDTWLYYVPRIGLSVFALIAIVLIITAISEKELRKENPTTFLSFLFIIGIGSLFAGVLYFSVGVVLIDLYRFVTTSSPMVVGLSTVLAGVALFLFRLKARAIYGLTEAIAGITVAMHRAPSGDMTSLPWDSDFFLAILTAGVYLVVRGMDNVHMGLTKEPLDPIASKVIAAISEWLSPVGQANSPIPGRVKFPHPVIG